MFYWKAASLSNTIAIDEKATNQNRYFNLSTNLNSQQNLKNLCLSMQSFNW